MAALATTEERDKKRLVQQLKRIMRGKERPEYRNYLRLVPRAKRVSEDFRHPVTPNPYLAQSGSEFYRADRLWRRLLHQYDPPHHLLLRRRHSHDSLRVETLSDYQGRRFSLPHPPPQQKR